MNERPANLVVLGKATCPYCLNELELTPSQSHSHNPFPSAGKPDLNFCVCHWDGCGHVFALTGDLQSRKLTQEEVRILGNSRDIQKIRAEQESVE